MSSSSHTIITVPTKQHDGGNDSALNTIFADDDAQKPKVKVDAFTKYSNNLIRMKTLLLLDLDDDDDDSDSLDYLGSLNEALRYIRVSDHATRNPGDAMKRRRGNDSQPICSGTLERKTRLSFELHPDLLLHDLIDLNNSVTIPDDDDDDDEPKE